jgi:predicted lipoprotein with Yx(FWY)xxD motif
MAAALLSGTAAWAQPADLPIPAATTAVYPPGVSVGSAGGVPVYTDAKGRTLYGMDMRVLLRAGADTSQHCQAACTAEWEPLLAPAGSTPNISFPLGFGDRRPAGAAGGARPDPLAEMARNQKAPDWTIIQGPLGPQWVYKGWHMVFVRKGDQPGSAAYDGAENMTWNTLKYVPPVPKVVGPVNVSTAFVDGAYALVGKDGRLLFSGSCGHDCAGWHPFTGPLASAGVGDWAVSRDTDAPQWLYRGQPVFIAQGATTADMPVGAKVLRP